MRHRDEGAIKVEVEINQGSHAVLGPRSIIIDTASTAIIIATKVTSFY
jgi:hypothetical protein